MQFKTGKYERYQTETEWNYKSNGKNFKQENYLSSDGRFSAIVILEYNRQGNVAWRKEQVKEYTFKNANGTYETSYYTLYNRQFDGTGKVALNTYEKYFKGKLSEKGTMSGNVIRYTEYQNFEDKNGGEKVWYDTSGTVDRIVTKDGKTLTFSRDSHKRLNQLAMTDGFSTSEVSGAAVFNSSDYLVTGAKFNLETNHTNVLHNNGHWITGVWDSQQARNSAVGFYLQEILQDERGNNVGLDNYRLHYSTSGDRKVGILDAIEVQGAGGAWSTLAQVDSSKKWIIRQNGAQITNDQFVNALATWGGSDRMGNLASSLKETIAMDNLPMFTYGVKA